MGYPSKTSCRGKYYIFLYWISLIHEKRKVKISYHDINWQLLNTKRFILRKNSHMEMLYVKTTSWWKANILIRTIIVPARCPTVKILGPCYFTATEDEVYIKLHMHQIIRWVDKKGQALNNIYLMLSKKHEREYYTPNELLLASIAESQ